MVQQSNGSLMALCGKAKLDSSDFEVKTHVDGHLQQLTNPGSECTSSVLSCTGAQGSFNHNQELLAPVAGCEHSLCKGLERSEQE